MPPGGRGRSRHDRPHRKVDCEQLLPVPAVATLRRSLLGHLPTSSNSGSPLCDPSQLDNGEPPLHVPGRRLVAEAVARAVFPGVEDPNVGDWYGNDALRVERYPRETIVKARGEELSAKFRWLIRGVFISTGGAWTGQLLPGSTSPDGLWSVRIPGERHLIFDRGCWEIAGKIANRSCHSLRRFGAGSGNQDG